MNHIYLMNLAMRFIPKGSIVLNINKEESIYRDSEDILINYSFRERLYIMRLGFEFNDWYIKDIEDSVENRDYNLDKNRSEFVTASKESLIGGNKAIVDWNSSEGLVNDMGKSNINMNKTIPNKVGEKKIESNVAKSNDEKDEKGYLGSLVGSGLGIMLDDENIVLGCVEGNITSLEKKSKICIIAKKYEKGNQLAQELFLTVQDIDGGFKESIKLDVDYGFSPNIGLYDFTGNGYFDILISMRSGGSGGYYFYYIYSYINRQFKKIFDWMEFNKKGKFTVKYLDNMKVSVVGGELNGNFIIDISQKDKAYLDSLYDSNGKLKAPVTGSVSGVVNLYPVTINNNRKFELHIICNILGVVTMDILGGVVYIEKWGGNSFEPLGERVILFGNTTYDNYGLSKLDPNYIFTPYDEVEANKNKQ